MSIKCTSHTFGHAVARAVASDPLLLSANRPSLPRDVEVDLWLKLGSMACPFVALVDNFPQHDPLAARQPRTSPPLIFRCDHYWHHTDLARPRTVRLDGWAAHL